MWQQRTLEGKAPAGMATGRARQVRQIEPGLWICSCEPRRPRQRATNEPPMGCFASSPRYCAWLRWSESLIEVASFSRTPYRYGRRRSWRLPGASTLTWPHPPAAWAFRSWSICSAACSSSRACSGKVWPVTVGIMPCRLRTDLCLQLRKPLAHSRGHNAGSFRCCSGASCFTHIHKHLKSH